MLFDLAIRSLWQQKVRSGLTVLGTVLAIAAIASLGSITEGISSLVNEQLKFAAGYITVMEAGQTSMSNGPPGLSSRIERSLVDEIKQLDGVSNAVPQIMTISSKDNLVVIGIPSDGAEFFNLKNIDFKEGGWFDETSKELIIGFKLAEMRGWKVGDTVQVKDDSYSVAGVIEELNNFIDYGALGPIDEIAGSFDFGDYISDIIVVPNDVSDSSRISSEIKDSYDGLDAVTSDEQVKRSQTAIATISIFTLGIGIIASLVASIGIINTMIMTVLERKKEFGIMKAIGAERGEILSIVLLEAIILGIIGGIIGISIGYFGAEALNRISTFPISKVTLNLVLFGVSYSIALAVLAALYPAYQAVKVNAVEAMRDE